MRPWRRARIIFGERTVMEATRRTVVLASNFHDDLGSEMGSESGARPCRRMLRLVLGGGTAAPHRGACSRSDPLRLLRRPARLALRTASCSWSHEHLRVF